MPTIYSGVPSVTDGPNCYHTVSYTATRSGADIILEITHKAWLQYAASWIGAGKYIDFYARCTRSGVTYEKRVVIKESSAEWHGTAPRTHSVTLRVKDVGTATSLSLVTGTYRSDGSVKPGVHKRTNTISVPAAVPPNKPGCTVPSSQILHTSTFTITATNNGTGSGSFYRYKYYYKRNSGSWVLLSTTTSSTRSFKASDHGGTYGDTFYFKVTIINTLGQSATSSTDSRKMVSRPTLPTDVAVSTKPITNINDIRTMTCSGATAGSGTIDRYRWHVITDDVEEYTSYIEDGDASETFSLAALGKPLGTRVRFRVTVYNSYGVSAGSWYYLPYIDSYEIPKGLAFIKVSGTYRKGQAYIKVSGTWRAAKEIFIKVKNMWRKGV